MQLTGIWIFLTVVQFVSAFFGWTKHTNTHQEPQVQVLKKCCGSLAVPDEKWITQKLDHFNPQDMRKWNMRYYEDLSNFEQDGPIFIYLGGEWTISPRSIAEGTLIHEMALDTHGALFYTEHRYYGKSHPTQNTTTENLRYLSVDQALADVAFFINFQRSYNSLMRNSKVIVVGASYSASMAAWMRLKYPHLVDGAFASSGPVHAKIDFYEYKEVMARSISKIGGESCQKIISNAFQDMEELVRYKNTSRISNAFNLCQDLDLPIDIPHFFYEVSDIVAGLVQTHRAGRIEQACQLMENARLSMDDIEAFAAWIRGDENLESKGILVQFSDESDADYCLDFSYENNIITFSDVEWGSLANQQMRQWIYQTCSEFAWFQTSTSKEQFFGTTYGVDYFIRICNDLYDEKFSKKEVEVNIRRTNVRYGGFKPVLRNVVFTNGDVDPWHPMSILEPVNEFVHTILIPLSSHVSDLGAISDDDSAEMRAAKQKVKELVLTWVGILNIESQ